MRRQGPDKHHKSKIISEKSTVSIFDVWIPTENNLDQRHLPGGITSDPWLLPVAAFAFRTRTSKPTRDISANIRARIGVGIRAFVDVCKKIIQVPRPKEHLSLISSWGKWFTLASIGEIRVPKVATVAAAIIALTVRRINAIAIGTAGVVQRLLRRFARFGSNGEIEDYGNRFPLREGEQIVHLEVKTVLFY